METTMEQRITIGQSKITFNEFIDTLRELIQQANEKVLRDSTLNMYVKFAIDELYHRLGLYNLPMYKLATSGFHTKDESTGLYIVDFNGNYDVYDADKKIATVPLTMIINKIDSVSFGKFGLCLQEDLGFLQHILGSSNDMYLKSIYWTYINNQLIVCNGPESIAVGTQRDATDGNPIIPVVDGSLGFVGDWEKYGFDTDIPNTRRTTPYYLTISRKPILPTDIGLDTSNNDMPLDFPCELVRLLLSTAQRICLEHISITVDPNLVQLVETQINNYVGGTNDTSKNT